MRKVVKSLLKDLYYCPMLLMRTTKQLFVYKQRKTNKEKTMSFCHCSGGGGEAEGAGRADGLHGHQSPGAAAAGPGH